jgi:hypothetical protein
MKRGNMGLFWGNTLRTSPKSAGDGNGDTKTLETSLFPTAFSYVVM